MAKVSKSTMREILTEVGRDLVAAIKGELERQGHVNTGRLRDSIGYNISEFGGNMTLTVLANEVDYASAINNLSSSQELLDQSSPVGVYRAKNQSSAISLPAG